jgi:mono/diheme cytochrome c family protein
MSMPVAPSDRLLLSAERVAAFLTLFEHNPAWGTAGRVVLVQHDEGGSVAAKDDCAMHVASQFRSLRKRWLGLFAVGAISVLIGAAAHAQNLDQGKSVTRLFADSCATCHRSARGLAKGRFRLTLYLFLQKHYASNSSSAWALSSYLESVDGAPRGRSRTAAAKPSPPATRTSGSSLRPPASVPEH